MKLLFVLILIAGSLFSQEFSKSSLCKSCHPIIYDEFIQSTHKNSSTKYDELHQKVWEKDNSLNDKKYECSSCHTPTQKDNEILSLQAKEEGISCEYCHRIQEISKHDKFNKNLINDKREFFSITDVITPQKSKTQFNTQSSFFGLFSSTEGSPYHKINYENNNIVNANVCQGCHSHYKNSHNIDVFKTEHDEKVKPNCIGCHMKKSVGTVSTIKKTKTHSSHKFAGAYNSPESLEEYVKFSIEKDLNSFTITIKNRASHMLFLSPFRDVRLKILVENGDKKIEFSKTYERILGDGKNELLFNEASVEMKNTLIKSNSKISEKFEYSIQKGDKVYVTLGYFLVKDKFIKELDLKDKKYSKFNILKKESFDF